MHCQWRWNKNLCFATFVPQIFCPHPSFPTSPCLYLVPTGWYEVGVDVQSRKRWRRWVYRSAISLEWVIRVDQWSRVEVTGWSQNFDRGPHIITRLSRHGRRRWKILGQTNVQNTQLHTHYCKWTNIVDFCIWIYICICTIFVFAFAFVCSVEVGPWANKQAITRLDHKHRWTMAPLWNHLYGHPLHTQTQILRITRTRYIPQRERGRVCCKLWELLWSPCGNTYIHISQAAKPKDK